VQVVRKPPIALRHVITHRVAFGAVAFTAITIAAFTAAAVAFFSTVTSGAARAELTGRPGSAIVISASATQSSLGHVTAGITGQIRAMLPGLSPSIQISTQSDIMNLPGRKAAPGHPAKPGTAQSGSGRAARAGKHRARSAKVQTQLTSMPALAQHIDVLSGTCSGSSAGGLVPVCAPATAARAMGLSRGERLTLRDTVTGTTVKVRLTGLFQAVQPRASYWRLSPMGAGSVQLAAGFLTAGPLIVSPAAAGSSPFPVGTAAEVGTPDFGRLSGTNLAPLGSVMARRISALTSSGSLPNVSVATQLPARLGALAVELVVARTQMLGSLLTLLVIGGTALALAVGLLGERRRAEAALLAARGASRPQLARRGLTDALLIAVPAAIAGPVLGALIEPLLVSSRTIASDGSGLSLAANLAVWLATAGVAAGCLAIIALPWLRRPPSPLRLRVRRGRQRSVAAAVYSRADLIVVAIAAGVAWQLIHSSGIVSSGLNGTLSADPILVIAPVLALVAGALLTLRLVPLAARLGDRLAARGRGVVMPIVAWQISRRALRQTGPTLLAVLAVAGAVMALSQRESMQRSALAQASFSVGADQRVILPPAGSLALGQVAGITSAPGVEASTPAIRTLFSLPSGTQATLLGIDVSAAPSIIPAQAGGPGPAILRQLTPRGQTLGALVPGRPGALRLSVTISHPRVAPRQLITQPQLSVDVTDAAGIGYVLPAGTVPADGKPHSLTISVAPARHADYPLRIAGFALEFGLPAQSAPGYTLTVSQGVALASARSTRGKAFAVVLPGDRLAFAASANQAGPAVSLLSQHASGGELAATFNPGFGRIEAPFYFRGFGTLTLSASYPGVGKPLPVVVTRSLLSNSGLRLGSPLQVSVGGITVPMTPVAAVGAIPTIGGGTPAVLVDQGSLASALMAAGGAPVPVTEWWLRTSRARPALTGLPAGTQTASRAQVARAFAADPLIASSQQAMIAIAIAAVLLALISLLVSVATATDRARDLALLDALGTRPAQVARLLGLEQAMTTIVTCCVGVLIGAGLSRLIIPAIALTNQAAKPVPPIVVQLPWLLAVAIALVVTAVPTLASVLSLPRRTAGAARTRLEEET
jgi:FtsX-like permease family